MGTFLNISQTAYSFEKRSSFTQRLLAVITLILQSQLLATARFSAEGTRGDKGDQTVR